MMCLFKDGLCLVLKTPCNWYRFRLHAVFVFWGLKPLFVYLCHSAVFIPSYFLISYISKINWSLFIPYNAIKFFKWIEIFNLILLPGKCSFKPNASLNNFFLTNLLPFILFLLEVFSLKVILLFFNYKFQKCMKIASS